MPQEAFFAPSDTEAMEIEFSLEIDAATLAASVSPTGNAQINDGIVKTHHARVSWTLQMPEHKRCVAFYDVLVSLIAPARNQAPLNFAREAILTDSAKALGFRVVDIFLKLLSKR